MRAAMILLNCEAGNKSTTVDVAPGSPSQKGGGGGGGQAIKKDVARHRLLLLGEFLNIHVSVMCLQQGVTVCNYHTILLLYILRIVL